MNQQFRYNVNEIYSSLQGEGTRVGLPFTFVRMQGCKLRCVWCDTPYALDRKVIATLMTISEISDQIRNLGNEYVMLTGGEPLEQDNILDLTTALCNAGYKVVIETNGLEDISKADSRCHIILDIKCPDSKMSKKNDYDNLKKLKAGDELKFVIASENDYLWAKQICEKYDLFRREFNVLFSPAFGLISPKVLAESIIKDKINVRMQLQIHKYIWEPNQRGV